MAPDSRLARLIAVLPVVASAKETWLPAVTNFVTSNSFQVAALTALLVETGLPKAGALAYVVVVSPQVILLTV